MFDIILHSDLLIPGLYLSASIIIGVLIEFVLLGRLIKIFKNKNNFFSEVVVKSLRGFSLSGFLLIGIFIAFYLSKIEIKYFNIVNKIIISLIVVNLTFFLSRLARKIFNFYSSGESLRLPSVTITINIIKISIYIIGLLLILQINGISITPMLTAIGISGLAVALALQETLSNFFAGIYMVLAKLVSVGDYVKLESGES